MGLKKEKLKVNPLKINDNLMLLDIQYVKKNYKTGDPDCLYIITKDIVTGDKSVTSIEEPTIPIYIEKPEARNHNYVKEYYRKDDLITKIVKYQDVPFAVANEIGTEGKNFVKSVQDTKSFKKLSYLNLYPYVCGQDYDIRTIYRHHWRKSMNGKSPMKIRKGYMDIETDVLSSPGMSRPAKDPVDLVSVADGENHIVYTFCLVEREYEELTDSEYRRLTITKEKRKALYEKRWEQEKYIMSHPGCVEERARKEFGQIFPEFDYKVFYYSNEAEMLVHLFQCIHKMSPDFLMIWNISFDIPYLISRMRVLGLNPEDVICDPEFKNKICKFNKDTINFEIKNKADHFEVSSKTIYVDQMENYAAIRKGGEELRNYKLDYIAKKESKSGGKYVYSSSTKTFRTLGYDDLIVYILYNIKDVLAQHGIEDNTMDIDNLYRNSYNNICPYEKCYMQSVVLRSVQYRMYDSQGLIPGANTNKVILDIDKEQHPEKYANISRNKKTTDIEGALVGNTKLINNFGQKLFGKRTNFLFRFSIDMDMKSFYPSTIIIMNISKSTLIFKVELDCRNYDVRGGSIPYHGFTDVELVEGNTPEFEGDIAAEVFDNFQCGNILSTGRKFLNLPSISELVREIEKELGVAV